MTYFTEKEKIIIHAILKNALNNIGGRNLQDLLSDFYTWFSVEDIQSLVDFNEHQIAGIISSLEKKNIILHDSDNQDLWVLTEDNNNVLHEIWDVE